MSRAIAACLSLLLIAAADGPRAGSLPHASGAPAGPGPGCGGGFTVARGDTLYSIARRCETSVAELVQENRLGARTRPGPGQRGGVPGGAGGRVLLDRAALGGQRHRAGAGEQAGRPAAAGAGTKAG